MKAVYHSQYRKPGTRALMFVYIVTGNKKEIEEYIAAQEASTNRAAGTWPKDENTGSPLWWLNADIEKRNGNMPKQSYTLIFNRDKSRIIRDDSAEQLAAFDRVNRLKEAKLAEFQAQIELGLIEVPIRGTTMRATSTGNIVAPEGEVKPETKSLADEIVAGIGEPGAEGAEGENLGD